MTDQRVQYDGVELDELVVEGATVHIEAMDAHHFMIRIYRPERIVDYLRQDAVDIHLSGADLFEIEETTGLRVIQREAIVYCHEWKDRSHRAHKCYERTDRHARHKCSCGATTKARP